MEHNWTPSYLVPWCGQCPGPYQEPFWVIRPDDGYPLHQRYPPNYAQYPPYGYYTHTGPAHYSWLSQDRGYYSQPPHHPHQAHESSQEDQLQQTNPTNQEFSLPTHDSHHTQHSHHNHHATRTPNPTAIHPESSSLNYSHPSPAPGRWSTSTPTAAHPTTNPTFHAYHPRPTNRARANTLAFRREFAASEPTDRPRVPSPSREQPPPGTAGDEPQAARRPVLYVHDLSGLRERRERAHSPVAAGRQRGRQGEAGGDAGEGLGSEGWPVQLGEEGVDDDYYYALLLLGERRRRGES